MRNNRISGASLPQFREEITNILTMGYPPKVLKEKLGEYHERDLAQALPDLTREEQMRLVNVLDDEVLAAVVEQEQGLEAFFLLGLRRRGEVLSRMEPAEASELLGKLSREEREHLLELVDEAHRREIRLVASFDEDVIGSRMSTNYIQISQGATVKEAMSRLVHQAAEHDNITTLYLVDEEGAFAGAMALKDLILAREGTALTEISMESYPYVYANTPVEDCVPFLRDYGASSIPVLDEKNHLLGVITGQDVVELVDDALGDDYAKLAGLSSEEDLAEKLVTSVKKRLPWLGILLVLGLGVSATVGLFESIVAQIPIIMCFQSLILDMAGNVGTQSLAVAIRVLMDDSLGRQNKAALVWKELRVGFVNGGILGLMSVGAIGAYLLLKGNTLVFAFGVSGCLGCAMVLAMGISSLSGTIIPIFFQKIGVDPAVASGPLITTVNDLVAVVSYYGLAWLVLLKWLNLG